MSDCTQTEEEELQAAVIEILSVASGPGAVEYICTALTGRGSDLSIDEVEVLLDQLVSNGVLKKDNSLYSKK